MIELHSMPGKYSDGQWVLSNEFFNEHLEREKKYLAFLILKIKLDKKKVQNVCHD